MKHRDVRISVTYGARRFVFHTTVNALDTLEREWLSYADWCRKRPDADFTDDDADNALQFVFTMLVDSRYADNAEIAQHATGALIWLARSTNFSGDNINYEIIDDPDIPGNVRFTLHKFDEQEIEQTLLSMEGKIYDGSKLVRSISADGQLQWRLGASQ